MMSRKQAHKKALWDFTGADGDFVCPGATRVRTLYFPLANEGLMASVTPDLHGDAKAGQDSFLYEPVSRIDLVNSRSSRNFWIRTAVGDVWSATGVSKDSRCATDDRACVSAGLLWHSLERSNARVGLRATVTTFIPSSGEPAEVTRIVLKNISRRKLAFTFIAALPIYARSAENIRDHRHVTSLLHRIETDRSGVLVRPTLLFSEAGHLPNRHTYFVLGSDAAGRSPESVFPTQEMFCGEGGDLEAPQAVYGPASPDLRSIQGREAFGGLRFSGVKLEPGAEAAYIVVAGIADDAAAARKIHGAFRTAKQFDASLAVTRQAWARRANDHRVVTGDRAFDGWFRWVSIQPTLRRIFGCSFLPDFDYGKGGRGWRDLWQDCLGLLLSEPSRVRELLVNNFAGVRIDGSNATIIGSRPGEFVSDRNNVSRVWMDHGVWPLLTVELYMNETGDAGILSEKAAYFLNHERSRSRVIDRDWKQSDGQRLLTAKGAPYEGTVFEHLLLQNLVQFYNVGAHNHVRLEGADWNDGLDMAKQHGESVAFSSMYARNLARLADIIGVAGWRDVELADEISILLRKCDYENIAAKHDVLNAYFHATNHGVSGETFRVDAVRLAADLREKAAWMMSHIRNTEWLPEGFFNGYYDNRKERVEGRRGKTVRMTLPSQVFPIMSGTASAEQVAAICVSAARWLRDRSLGGYRLNTDFGEEQHDFGRAFSFAYGDKENGAFFSHMAVMFAYALYARGFIAEGWRVLKSISDMALNAAVGRIYPCLPEYFDDDGRGMYAYLTGSASWYVLTLVTEVFGLKGEMGALTIAPKICRSQFKSRTISVTRVFAGRRLIFVFHRPSRGSGEACCAVRVVLGGAEYPAGTDGNVRIPRAAVEALNDTLSHTADVFMEHCHA